MVEKFGTLVEFDFLYHRSGPQAGQPRGYAFVTYADIECAKRAQKTLDGIEVLGKTLAVKWAHTQDESKFTIKEKPPPPILSISDKSTTSGKPSKMNMDGKIAALEAKLRTLEDKSVEPFIAPDIGASKKPANIIYNYIEKKRVQESTRRPYKRRRNK